MKLQISPGERNIEISLLDGSTFYDACNTSAEFVQILFMTFATAVYDRYMYAP